MKKKHMIGLAIAIVVLLSTMVFASSYEWLSNQRLSGTFNADDPTNTNKIYWNIETSGDYYEYRTLYVCNDTTSVCDINCDSTRCSWQQITNCDHEGNVNGLTQDRCYDESFTGYTIGTYPARVTTNYAGCTGTYTPTPNTASCGDILAFNVTLT